MKSVPTIFEALHDACAEANIPHDTPLVRFVFKEIAHLAAFERVVRVQLAPYEGLEAMQHQKIRGIAYELRTSQRQSYVGIERDMQQALIEAKAAYDNLFKPRISRDEALNAQMALGRILRIFDEPGIPPGVISRRLPDGT